MIKKVLLIILCFWATGATFAQQDFTLKQCIDYGLQNHGSVEIYKNEKLKAKQTANQAISNYLPQVNGSFTIDDNLKLATTVIPAGTFGPGTAERTVSFGSKFNSGASVQVDQTLYDQSLTLAVKASNLNTELSDINKLQNDENIIYSIANSYYQVLVFRQHLKLLTVNKAKYQRLLEISKLQAEKGIIKKVDYDRIKVSLNNTLSQISVAENNYELAKNRLKNAMGLSIDLEINLTDTALLTRTNLAKDSSNFDVSNRLDYKSEKVMGHLLHLQSMQVLSTGFPRLSAYARYGATAMGNDLVKSYDRWFDYSAVGLKLTVPVFSGLKRVSQYKSARFDELNQRIKTRLNENNYRLQFENAKSQLSKSQNTLITDEQNVELAKEVFDNTSLQYQQGVASLSELLNAESAYKEAEVNYVNSLLTYYISQLDLQKSNGTIKEWYNEQ